MEIKYWPRKNVVSSFLDTVDQKLEDRLNEIIISFIKIMWHTNQYRLLEQQRNEMREQKMEAEERRKEQIQQENQRKAVLRYNSLAWAEADLLRSYVHATDRKLADGSIKANPHEFEAWRSWALNHANEIDPLANGTALNVEEFPQYLKDLEEEVAATQSIQINPTTAIRRQSYFVNRTFVYRFKDQSC